MRNKEVVEQFVNYRIASSGNGNLTSTGDRLYSYATCIAEWVAYPHKIIVNATKYSTTTSCHQGMLRYQIKNFQNIPIVDYVHDIQRGTSKLSTI